MTMVVDPPRQKRQATVSRKRARPARIGASEGLIALVCALCFLELFYVWFLLLRHVPPEKPDRSGVLTCALIFGCGLLFAICSARQKSRIGWVLAGLALAIMIALAVLPYTVAFR
jgi:peptidoglycan/LPS O-acetylase OafA/YrhL